VTHTPTSAPAPEPTSQWRLRAFVLAIAFVLLGCLLATLGPDGSREGAEQTGKPRSVATTFRMATFNVLGADHTAPGGNRPGWASGEKRMEWAVKLIREQDLSLVGLQEFQPPQYKKFKEITGKEWGVYPGNKMGAAETHNSVIWRRDVWKAVERRTIGIPYFRGNMIKMPYVLVRNKETGRRVWIFNSHNPADTRGPAAKWRSKGFQIEADLVTRLRATYPGVPVVTTGDKNSRDPYVCHMVAKSEQHASNGGFLAPSGCDTGAPLKVDWTTGSQDVYFTRYSVLDKGLINKTSDHPLIMSDVNLPPQVSVPVEHVVVVAVDGLSRKAILETDPALLPTLQGLRTGGASTLDARTVWERGNARPNAFSLLTGRPVDPARGGHGVGWRSGPVDTVATAAGRYVSSVFDLVHNLGRTTAYYSSAPWAPLVQASYDADSGGVDPYGVDDGRDKIDVTRLSPDDDAAVTRSLLDSVKNGLPSFTYAELTTPARMGSTEGWRSESYTAALAQADARLGRLLSRVQADPELSSNTLVVVTGLAGGSGRATSPKLAGRNFRVPMLVSGIDVAVGDLYALNPELADPGRSRPSYDGVQPLRVGAIGNLVTSVLGIPAIPGSSFNSDQSWHVFTEEPAS